MASNLPSEDPFAPNSNKYKQGLKEKEAKKDIKPVTSAKIKEKGIGDKFKEAVIAEDGKDVLKWLFKEKVIPESKNIFVDMVFEGLSMLLGTSRRSNSNRTDYASVSRSYTYNSNGYSYGNYSGSSSKKNDVKENTRSDFRDIVYKSKDDANEVLSSLQSFAEEYDRTSVSDLYELSGFTAKAFTDNNYGWTFPMLMNVPIKRVREGYILDLPNPIPID